MSQPSTAEGLPYVTAADIERIARKLTLTDFETGRRIPWVPSRAQVEYWALTEANQRCMIGKPRRAFVSTAGDVDDVLQTMVCDSQGHRVRTGVMLDVEDKVTERMWQMSDFLTQLNVKHRATDFYIEFPGKSEIVGLTAGGKRAAASTGFQRMRYSEFSYYGDPESMASTSSSVGKYGREVIETTIDLGAANGQQARHYWRDPANGFTKLFIPFEWLTSYRTGAGRITDEQWAYAQSEGFTDRESAAYWLAELLPNKCGGNIVQLMHEFPQIEPHMFQTSTGRWVNKTSRVLEPVEVWKVMGHGGEVWPIMVWTRPADTSGKIVITADAAKGAGVSRATLMAIDEDSGRCVASLAEPLILGDDHARCAWEMWQRFSRERTLATGIVEQMRPRVMAEDNTTGQIFIQPARRLGLPLEVFDTSEVSQLLGMQHAKRAIEVGMLEGPKELAEECDECTRDPVTGKFKGRKDLMMSYGFWAWKRTPAQALGPPKEQNRERRVDGARMIRAAMRQERGNTWGRR